MKGNRAIADSLLTTLAPAIWGSTYLVTTELLPPDSPLLASVIRALPAGLILLAVGRKLPTGVWWWRALALGVLNIGAFFYFLFVAAYLLPGGVAALVMSSQPIIVLLLGTMLLGEKIRRLQMLACVIGAVGVAFLVLQPTAHLDTIGILAGLAGAISMATGIVLTKRWGRPEGVSLLNFTGWQLSIGGLVLVPIALMTEGIPETMTGLNWIGFAYLSIIGALIAYALWFRGIERLPAATVSFLSFASPLSATILGFIFLGQSLSPAQILGATAIIAAIVLAQTAKATHPTNRIEQQRSIPKRTESMNYLFDPTMLGDISIGNRIVMAPMTRNRATIDGLATPLMATYYAQRASAGLIISEGIQPSIVGQGFTNTPGLHNKNQTESWKQVTQTVHKKGGRIIAQLMHSGRIGHPSLYPSAHSPVGPSAIAAKEQTYTPSGMLDFPVPSELSAEEIAQTIQDFATAARNAIDAGFDGVEIHAGNGFLLHQFLSDNTNQRTDEYGGSLPARARFVVEVAEAVVTAIGAGRTGMRISPANPYNDISESDTLVLYRELLSRLPNMAFLHVMESNNRAQTQAIREQWEGSLILNPHETPEAGSVSPEIAESVLESELAAAVCFGSLFVANPDLPARIKAGGPYNKADESAFYGGDHRGYTDYPFLSMAVMDRS